MESGIVNYATFAAHVLMTLGVLASIAMIVQGAVSITLELSGSRIGEYVRVGLGSVFLLTALAFGHWIFRALVGVITYLNGGRI